MSAERTQFNFLSRLLHWTMAAMILAMLFIGVAMVASLADYHVLISLHRPLGIAIFVLAIARLANRLLSPPPPLPASMPRLERLAATASEFTMYGLMFASARRLGNAVGRALSDRPLGFVPVAVHPAARSADVLRAA